MSGHADCHTQRRVSVILVEPAPLPVELTHNACSVNSASRRRWWHARWTREIERRWRRWRWWRSWWRFIARPFSLSIHAVANVVLLCEQPLLRLAFGPRVLSGSATLSATPSARASKPCRIPAAIHCTSTVSFVVQLIASSVIVIKSGCRRRRRRRRRGRVGCSIARATVKPPPCPVVTDIVWLLQQPCLGLAPVPCTTIKSTTPRTCGALHPSPVIIGAETSFFIIKQRA